MKYSQTCFTVRHPLNLLSPNSDQHQFSPNIIHTFSRDKVRRINKMITKEKMPWSFIKFSQLILKGNVCRSLWRICTCILGLKGLIWTPYYYRQFVLSLGKESPYIFSKFNPLYNTDIPFNTETFSCPLSVRTNDVWLYNLIVFLKQKLKCVRKNIYWNII